MYVAKRDWPPRRKVLAEQYAYMVEHLGGYCGACVPEMGCGSKTDLQLHHIDGKEWAANKVGPKRRGYLLFVDFLMGRLGVLCRDCNQRDGSQRKRYYLEKKTAEAPF